MVTRALLAACVCSILASAAPAAETPDAGQVAARVDKLLAARWVEEGVEPASAASDAEFLRRAYLDLAGIIPPVSRVRSFLADGEPDKRARLIDELLARPEHFTHLANTWRKIMLPAGADLRRLGGGAGFERWLRDQFADNVPYDELVRSVLTATGNVQQSGPVLFYTALELKPEELAASTSRIFLGVQISCAQCHDHPFDHWTREDFWGYAAFFARIQPPGAPQQRAFQVAEADSGELNFPDTERVVAPRYLGGPPMSEDTSQGRREQLARWMTAAENPWFARATVNRVWAHLFGRGLVEPVDDLGAHNPATHPELLRALAEHFVASGYDLRSLFRTLANTRAYQLTSAVGAEESREELYHRMAIKSLTAEQLYDCLFEAIRRTEAGSGANAAYASRAYDAGRQSFLAKFQAPTQGATEFQAGIPQALTLMNGSIIRQATDLSQSDLLVALEAPFFTNDERVETLFLSTLSRLPTDAEREKFVAYVDGGGATGSRREALGDVLWALLNSAEFVLNH